MMNVPLHFGRLITYWSMAMAIDGHDAWYILRLVGSSGLMALNQEDGGVNEVWSGV